MEFKDRMKLLREEANLTQDELAQKLEITKAAISNYETGRRKPDYELLEKIGDFFNVDLLYLFGKQDKKKADFYDRYERNVSKNPEVAREHLKEFMELQKKLQLKYDAGINLFNYDSIPLIGQIAAGSPILADVNIDGYFMIDSSIKADFGLRVQGDSMIDEGIFDGDIVFLRQQPTLENGEIGAVVIGEEATLKRFYRNDGFISLNAANKEYQPMIITDGDIRIAGKLVAVLNIR